jgi:hypothetical protein
MRKIIATIVMLIALGVFLLPVISAIRHDKPSELFWCVISWAPALPILLLAMKIEDGRE